MPIIIKTLKKENTGFKMQVKASMKQIKNLQAKIDGTVVDESSRASTWPCSSATIAIEEPRIPWIRM